MASPVTVEAVLSSLIINNYVFFVLFTTAYTNLCLNPEQTVYLLIPIILLGIPISCPGHFEGV